MLKFLIALSILVGCTPQNISREKKIVIWHWMIDRKGALEELAIRYKKQTGVTVEFKLFFPPDIYSQKVVAAARAGTLPEIFGILGEMKTLGSFIAAGHILNLMPFMEEAGGEWRNSFYPQTLEVVTFREKNTYGVASGVYGVPIDTTMMQFLYHKDLFKKGGINPEIPPETFEEFVRYAQSVKEKTGAYGFICGWGEGWLLNCLATEWAMNLMGEERFIKTIEGEVKYTDEDWVKVFSLFAQLRDSGILAPNITTMINKEAEDAFAKDKAVFSFNGSWSVNVYQQLNPNLEYAFFPLPKIVLSRPVRIWGGAGSAFMVNAKSPFRNEAVKFLRWLTSKEQQEFLILKTNNLPAIRGCETNLSPLLKTLVDDFNKLTHPNIWPRNEDSRVLEVMNTGLQQIILGLTTPQKLARDIQETKERVLRQ